MYINFNLTTKFNIPKRKRKDTENVNGSRLCGHCGRFLRKTTYFEHRSKYYDRLTGRWKQKVEIQLQGSKLSSMKRHASSPKIGKKTKFKTFEEERMWPLQTNALQVSVPQAQATVLQRN